MTSNSKKRSIAVSVTKIGQIQSLVSSHRSRRRTLSSKSTIRGCMTWTDRKGTWSLRTRLVQAGDTFIESGTCRQDIVLNSQAAFTNRPRSTGSCSRAVPISSWLTELFAADEPRAPLGKVPLDRLVGAVGVTDEDLKALVDHRVEAGFHLCEKPRNLP